VEYTELKKVCPAWYSQDIFHHRPAFKLQTTEKDNVEVLWRLGRACRVMASALDPKDAKRKELLTEGQ